MMISTHEIVSKIVVKSGNVYLYSYGTLIAQVCPNQFDNKARPDTELHDLVNMNRLELYRMASCFFN